MCVVHHSFLSLSLKMYVQILVAIIVVSLSEMTAQSERGVLVDRTEVSEFVERIVSVMEISNRDKDIAEYCNTISLVEDGKKDLVPWARALDVRGLVEAELGRIGLRVESVRREWEQTDASPCNVGPPGFCQTVVLFKWLPPEIRVCQGRSHDY